MCERPQKTLLFSPPFLPLVVDWNESFPFYHWVPRVKLIILLVCSTLIDEGLLSPIMVVS